MNYERKTLGSSGSVNDGCTSIVIGIITVIVIVAIAYIMAPTWQVTDSFGYGL